MRITRTQLVSAGPLIALGVVVAALFVFLLTISPYPAGDDPGYHTMVIKYLMLNHDMHFTMPFFPQLGQLWGSVRFVTPLVVSTFATVTGITDVFRLSIGFAALCAALALIPVYLLIAQWLRSRTVAVLAVAYLAFSKFYLANFFQGSYEQYTGALFLSWVLYAQYRWTTTKAIRWLWTGIALAAVLYKTHELGFLVAVLFVLVSTLNAVRVRWGLRWFIPALVLSMTALGAFMALNDTYFAASMIDYPVRKMLGTDEGTPAIAVVLLAIGAAVFLLRRFQFEVLAYFGIALMLSQSAFLGSSFYPYRFNLYFLQAVALLIAVALDLLLRSVRRLRGISVPIVILLFMSLIVIPQYLHIRGLGLWITGQKRNPESVVLADDVAMYRWIKDHTPKDAIFAAPFKWGYYLPAIAERSVVVDDAIGSDSRDVRWNLAGQTAQLFVEPSAEKAAALAKQLNVRYVLWDAIFSKYPENHRAYDQEKFGDPAYFREANRINNTVLYEVL